MAVSSCGLSVVDSPPPLPPRPPPGGLAGGGGGAPGRRGGLGWGLGRVGGDGWGTGGLGLDGMETSTRAPMPGIDVVDHPRRTRLTEDDHHDAYHPGAEVEGAPGLLLLRGHGGGGGGGHGQSGGLPHVPTPGYLSPPSPEDVVESSILTIHLETGEGERWRC